jgi:hypothetical protein
MVKSVDGLHLYFLTVRCSWTLIHCKWRRPNYKLIQHRTRTPSGVATRKACDVKPSGVPVPSKERDRVSDASRRLTGTESNIRGTHKWHIRPAFSRRKRVVLRSVSVACSGEWVWVAEWREIATAELNCALCSEVNLWSTEFETGVSAVNISRQ